MSARNNSKLGRSAASAKTRRIAPKVHHSNPIAARLMRQRAIKTRLGVPADWIVLGGGAVVLPPKMTVGQWIERQESEPFQPPDLSDEPPKDEGPKMPWEQRTTQK